MGRRISFYLVEEVRKGRQCSELPTKTRINREEVGSLPCSVCVRSGHAL